MKKPIDIINTDNEPNIIQKMEWGGARKNAGAKPKYNEPTDTIAFRCPISKIPEVKKIIKDQLKKYSQAKSDNSNLDDLNPNL